MELWLQWRSTLIVHRQEGEKGFTLLELLVAISIFAIISAMTFQGLHSMIDNREIMDNESNRLASLQRAMVMMSRDFEQIVDRTVRDEFLVVQPALSAKADSKTIVEFSRGGFRNPAGLARSTILRVSYRLADRILVRETWPVLDRAVAVEPVSSNILTGVDDIKLRFLDVNRVWHPVWPPEEMADSGNKQLPLAVEAVLELEDWGMIKRLFLLPGEGGG